jgi:hypothetical protein
MLNVLHRIGTNAVRVQEELIQGESSNHVETDLDMIIIKMSALIVFIVDTVDSVHVCILLFLSK